MARCRVDWVGLEDETVAVLPAWVAVWVLAGSEVLIMEDQNSGHYGYTEEARVICLQDALCSRCAVLEGMEGCVCRGASQENEVEKSSQEDGPT